MAWSPRHTVTCYAERTEPAVSSRSRNEKGQRAASESLRTHALIMQWGTTDHKEEISEKWPREADRARTVHRHSRSCYGLNTGYEAGGGNLEWKEHIQAEINETNDAAPPVIKQ